MAEDEDDAGVVLGAGEAVEGAPLARISARLMWGIEREEIETREGDTLIRTPDGPRELGDILASVDEPYFATQREFEEAVRAVIGTGPVPTAGTAGSEESDTEKASEPDADSNAEDDTADSDSDTAESDSDINEETDSQSEEEEKEEQEEQEDQEEQKKQEDQEEQEKGEE